MAYILITETMETTMPFKKNVQTAAQDITAALRAAGIDASIESNSITPIGHSIYLRAEGVGFRVSDHDTGAWRHSTDGNVYIFVGTPEEMASFRSSINDLVSKAYARAVEWRAHCAAQSQLHDERQRRAEKIERREAARREEALANRQPGDRWAEIDARLAAAGHDRRDYNRDQWKRLRLAEKG